METTPQGPPAATSDAKRRFALGKGIESLLGPRPEVPAKALEPAGEAGQPVEIALDRIDRNPYQTRTTFDEGKLEELARSIAATGVVQPITVRELGDGRFQLIMGERRLRASKLAGKATIPCVVRRVSDETAMEMTIVENLQREDLNPMEQAHAFERLSREFKLTQEQIATRTGKDRASVGNFLRLLKLPEAVQTLVEAGELTFGHARALLGLDSPETMAKAVERIRSTAMSVRQTEAYVQGLMNPEARIKGEPSAAKPPQDPNVREAQDLLQQRLGLRVKIEDRKGKGRVIIEYSGIEDFDALLAALGDR